MADKLFPLPLSPFEFYYWCDNRPDYPTTFPIELRFRGSLSRESFERALQVCLDRHPLLRANVDDSTGKIPNWIAVADRSLPLDWAGESLPIDHAAGRFIDLTTDIGVRVWVRVTAHQSRVVLQFHHACCDALGGLRFVGDLLVAYDSIASGSDPNEKLPPLDPKRLLMRADYGLSEINYQPNFRDALTTARFWGHCLMRRPALLATPETNSPSATDGNADLGYLTHTLSKPDRDKLQARATANDSSINDLLIAETLIVMRDWNRTHGGDSRKLVLNVPVSLRTRADLQMPAANVLGFWFLERKPKDCDDPQALIQGIRDEMDAVKKWRLPLYFIGGLSFAAQRPWLIRRMLRSNRSFATGVLSNAGRTLGRLPLEREDHKWLCGGCLLEKITGVPPVRPGTRVSIILAYYGHDTYVNLNWDPNEFDESAARLLLAAFVERLTVEV